MKNIKEARRKEMEDKYHQFYKKKIIEEKELPKYRDHHKQWWTLRRNHKTSAGERSRVKLKQQQKFWAKDDKILVSDVDGTEAPIDPFKTEHHLKSASFSRLLYTIPTSPTKVLMDPFKGRLKHNKTQQKWSMLESFHRGNPKNRFETQLATLLTTDSKPLFSSFTKSGHINIESTLKLEGPAKVNLKKLFKGVNKMQRLKDQKLREELLQNSLKLQEEHNKVMFRTTLAKGIRTSGFKLSP